MSKIITLTGPGPGLDLSRRRFIASGAAMAAFGLASPYLSSDALAQAFKGKRMGYSQSFSTIEFLVMQRQGVIDTAAKYGFDLTVTDAGDRPAKQVTDLEDLLTRKMDVVLISTYYAEAITPAVNQINAAGIPIIMLSSSLVGTAKSTAVVASDNLATARKIGEYTVKRLGGKGNVVHIEGKTGSVVNGERSRGWREEVDKNPDIKIVGHAVANYERVQALRKMEDFLQANRKIDAVYCNNDDMAIGAIQAIKEAGRQDEMFVVGYDGVQPSAMQAIASGDLSTTWANGPFGVPAVEVAVRVLQGEKVPQRVIIDSPQITKENLSQYYDAATNKMKPRQFQMNI